MLDLDFFSSFFSSFFGFFFHPFFLFSSFLFTYLFSSSYFAFFLFSCILLPILYLAPDGPDFRILTSFSLLIDVFSAEGVKNKDCISYQYRL
ncbi:hypothetical protein LI328DRAFT_92052 [Trichoderma asperelloides]|nr:hypothetical protein LI328DRAFT_92052 [Trichoderma asperelloides]